MSMTMSMSVGPRVRVRLFPVLDPRVRVRLLSVLNLMLTTIPLTSTVMKIIQKIITAI